MASIKVVVICAIAFSLLLYREWSISYNPTPLPPEQDLATRLQRLVQFNQRLRLALDRVRASTKASSAALGDKVEAHNGFAYVFYATADAYACSALVSE
jgi:hypothetical protein